MTAQPKIEPETDPVMIRLEEARKIYPMGAEEVRALDGVSVSFRRGSFWAIMGPILDDDDLSEFRLRHLGFIFQSFNLIPQLTVQRNIELPLYYLGWEAEESAERARELARMVGLEDRLNHRPTELSGGQMQRVAIARALANDPQILLADEPTGNLDSTTGEQILKLLVELNGQGKTIIMVTHEDHIAKHAKIRLHMKDGVVDRIEGDIDETN
ncbi:MAG: ABC transporter ATP-binding protein [Deltaproteobacteria bacterium]|nr:ABC transporter ATP-binding protein [Deltaproteobacteria bacterium]